MCKIPALTLLRFSLSTPPSTRTADLPAQMDLSPRLGVAYDVFGNGKTSVKINLGRYLDAASNNNGNYSITNPTSRMAGSTARQQRNTPSRFTAST